MLYLFLSHLEALKIRQKMHLINLRKTSMAAYFFGLMWATHYFFPKTIAEKKM